MTTKQLSIVVKVVDQAVAPLNNITQRVLGVGTAVVQVENKATASARSGTGLLGWVSKLTGGLVSLKGLVAGALGGFAAYLGAQGAWNALDGAAQTLESIGDLSERLGLSVKTVSQLRYAAKLANIDLESMAGNFSTANKNITQFALTGSGKAADAIKRIGLNVRDSNGQVRSFNDTLPDLLDGLAKLPKAERAFAADKIFGGGGSRFLLFLNQGATALKAYNKEAQALGVVFDDEQIEAASKYRDAIDRVSEAWLGLRVRALIAVGPDLTDALNTVAKVMAAMPAMIKTGLKNIRAAFSGDGDAIAKVSELLDSVGELVQVGLMTVLNVAAVTLHVGIPALLETIAPEIQIRVGGWIKRVAFDIVSLIPAWGEWLTSGFVSIIGKVATAVLSFASGMVRLILDNLGNLIGGLASMWSGILSGVMSAADAITDKLVDVASGVLAFFGGLVNEIFMKLAQVIRAGSSAVSGSLHAMGLTLRPEFAGIAAGADIVGKEVAGSLEQIGLEIGGGAGSLTDRIQEATHRLGNFSKSINSTILGGLGSGIDDVGKSLSERFHNVAADLNQGQDSFVAKASAAVDATVRKYREINSRVLVGIPDEFSKSIDKATDQQVQDLGDVNNRFSTLVNKNNQYTNLLKGAWSEAGQTLGVVGLRAGKAVDALFGVSEALKAVDFDANAAGFAMKHLGERTVEAKTRWERFVEGASSGVDTLGNEVENLEKLGENVATTGVGGLADAFAKATVESDGSLKKFASNLRQFTADVLKQVGMMIARWLFLKAIMAGLGAIFSGSTVPDKAAGTYAGNVGTPVMETGGVIARIGNGVAVQRFAGGGIAMGPMDNRDSIPAMLRHGEGVLNNRAMNNNGDAIVHHMNRGGRVQPEGSGNSIVINNVIQISGQQASGGMSAQDLRAIEEAAANGTLRALQRSPAFRGEVRRAIA